MSDPTLKPAGYFVSKLRAIILLILFLIIVTAVGLMAGLLPKRKCPEEVKPVVSKPEYIHNNSRLPEVTIPRNYTLDIFPDFYNDGSTFSGSVIIDIDIEGTIDELVIHIKYLKISKTKVNQQILII